MKCNVVHLFQYTRISEYTVRFLIFVKLIRFLQKWSMLQMGVFLI
jgi:hypothetical protein